MAQNADAMDHLLIDSCGTGAWHAGERPDSRATAAAAKRGYDLSKLRARAVSKDDFRKFDYILAMDEDNLKNLKRMAPKGYRGHLSLFTHFAKSHSGDVPDPYYGGGDGFERVLDLVEDAAAGLLNHMMGRAEE